MRSILLRAYKIRLLSALEDGLSPCETRRCSIPAHHIAAVIRLIAGPTDRVIAKPDVPMKRGGRPVAHLVDEPVLDWIDVNGMDGVGAFRETPCATTRHDPSATLASAPPG